MKLNPALQPQHKKAKLLTRGSPPPTEFTFEFTLQSGSLLFVTISETLPFRNCPKTPPNAFSVPSLSLAKCLGPTGPSAAVLPLKQNYQRGDFQKNSRIQFHAKPPTRKYTPALPENASLGPKLSG